MDRGAKAEDSAAIRRSLRRVVRRACLGAGLGVLGVGALLALGAGLVGARLGVGAGAGDRAQVQRLVERTTAELSALPLAELAALDGVATVYAGRDGDPTFRIDYAVSPIPDGLRIHAVLIDLRTREAIDDVVAFRVRS